MSKPDIRKFFIPVSPEEAAEMDRRRDERIAAAQSVDDLSEGDRHHLELTGKLDAFMAEKGPIDFLQGTSLIQEPTVSTRQVIPEDEGDDDTLPWNDRTWDIFADTLGGLESSNQYGISGGYNSAYDGRYQVGRLAKLDAGARLGIELGHDPASREAFRNDPDLQERVFEAYTQSNHEVLSRISSRYRGMSRNEKMATLAVAHLLGSGGAKEFLKGTDNADGFGTKGSQYYEAILTALKQ